MSTILAHKNNFNTSPVFQVLVGNILPATGTTVIPLDNNLPLISNGTEIWSQSITPFFSTSYVSVLFNIEIDTSGPPLVCTVFRNSVCIGSRILTLATGTQVSSNTPMPLPIAFIDSPNTILATTYSARIGVATAGTWYVNSESGGNNLGGTLVSQYVLMEMTQ